MQMQRLPANARCRRAWALDASATTVVTRRRPLALVALTALLVATLIPLAPARAVAPALAIDGGTGQEQGRDAEEAVDRTDAGDGAAAGDPSPPDGDGGDAPAIAVVERLQKALLAYMQAAGQDDDGAPPDAAVEALHDAVLATHDFPYISRIVLGRLWRELDASDRERFRERFVALSLATYADRFADFEGESFSITGAGEGSFGQRRVTAELVTPDETRDFEYLLRRSGDDAQWLIVNIIVDGVSDLALKRAEYATHVSEHGFEGLLAELERQRDALTEG